MRLDDLLWGVDIKGRVGQGQPEITSIIFDSRKVTPGALFCCFAGLKSNGHDFVASAIENGAVAVLCERRLDLPMTIPQVIVEDARLAMALCCGNYFGNPSQKMHMIGVTGTNGKTTVTHLIKSIAEAYGQKVGLIGTVYTLIDQEMIHAEMTTPDPFEFHELLARMLQAGVQWVVMEVSAHALWLRKMAGVFFDVGVWTNFTQDHLNDFGTMQNYFEAKTQLFRLGVCGKAILAMDDSAVSALRNRIVIPSTTFGFAPGSDVHISDLKMQSDGIMMNLHHEGRIIDVRLGIPGKFSALNAAAAAAACVAMGVPWPVVRYGLRLAKGVPGRMEVVSGGMATFLVDYAHTPDALENVLSAARSFTKGRLIAVLGCGGDRDGGKRPIMGKIASSLADVCIITSDNPRTEDPQSIVDAIYQGTLGQSAEVECIVDRRLALAHAVSIAQADDVVVVAGKGHEDYQEIHGVKYPFLDRQVIEELLATLPH